MYTFHAARGKEREVEWYQNDDHQPVGWLWTVAISVVKTSKL